MKEAKSNWLQRQGRQGDALVLDYAWCLHSDFSQYDDWFNEYLVEALLGQTVRSDNTYGRRSEG